MDRDAPERDEATQRSLPRPDATTAPGGCPDSDELAAMIAGTLDASRIERVLIHVDRCAICAEVMATLGQLDAAPRAAGRYQLGRVLGAGGMGIVYDAWDPQLQRRVALKQVRPERADATAHARMLREARALARINHPNVVAVFDVSEHDGRICVATELVDGETLATWRGRSRAEIVDARGLPAGGSAAEWQRGVVDARGLPAGGSAAEWQRGVVDAWLQAARGLAAAHAMGVVHRDVKPSNVFVGRDGRVRVGDFGLARIGAAREPEGERVAGGPLESRLTASGHVAGTPAYMAPEQAEGEVDARSDQFSLCVALAEALTGARPVADAAPMVADAPALSRVLARGLRAEPSERFASMSALVEALERAVAPAKRRWPRVVAVLAAAAVAAGWLAWPSAEACEAPRWPRDAWSTAQRARVAPSLPAVASERVDRWQAAWTASAAEVCKVDRDDAALRARRARCLGDALVGLRSAITRWDSGALNAASASIASEELPLIARCSHAVQRTVDDATVAQALLRVPLLLRAVAAALSPPSLAGARARLADAADDPALAARFALDVAALEVDPARAQATLRAAIASSSGLPAAQARVALLGTLGADPKNEASSHADAVRATLAAIGGDAALEAELDLQLGSILRARSQSERAGALFERAAHAYRAAYGPDSLHEANALVALAGAHAGVDPNGANVRAARDAAAAIFRRAQVPMPLVDALGELGRDPDGLVAQLAQAVALARQVAPGSATEAEAEYDLAAAYVIANRDDAALPHYLAAATLLEQLGIRSAKLASALSQSAAILNDAKRAKEALPLAQRAAQVAEASGADIELGGALTIEGQARLALDDTAGAAAVLTRALAIRDRLHEPAQLRGNTRFLLATALWPRAPARARDLAHAARVDLQSFVDGLDPSDPSKTFLRDMQAQRLARIERWLASHR